MHPTIFSVLHKFRLPLAIVLGCVFASCMVLYRPGYLTSAEFLGMLIFMQLFAAILWEYASRFFMFLMIAFLGPAVALPLQGMWTSARWFVLGAGALTGLIVYLKGRRHSLGLFHVVAFFCVVAALVSSQMSAYSGQALLKSLSLFLLFLYGAAGARVAALGRVAQFSSGLLLGCELLIYLAVVAYFGFHVDLFGNPNSLGALMGVVAVPLLLWGVLTTNDVVLRNRRTFGCCVALFLLLFSYARAGIAAAAVSSILLCMSAHRYKLLVQGCVLTGVLAVAVFLVAPPPSVQPTSVSAAFLYKGKQESGLLGSRRSVWDRTLSTIEEHPWFGTGFGTASRPEGTPEAFGMFSSTADTTEEHGNSYLAIAEGVGLVGFLPFAALVLLLLRNVSGVWFTTVRQGNIQSLAVPIAAIVSAGLIHAAFEDWLFSVGYYLCVFFWAFAFMLVDFIPLDERDAIFLPSSAASRAEAFSTVPASR